MDSGELLLDDVLVDDDIQEEEKDIKDIRDHHSKERIATLQSGLNNCSHFLKSYCAKEKINYMRLEDIPFEGINGKGNAFWDKIIASFITSIIFSIILSYFYCFSFIFICFFFIVFSFFHVP